MAIVSLPPELNIVLPLTCAICRVSLPLKKATAGLRDRTGQQTFACVSHLSDVERLITGWADFMAIERSKYDQEVRKSNNLNPWSGGCHAQLGC